MIGHLPNGVFHPGQTKLVLVLELSPHQGLWGQRHPGPHSEDAEAQCGDAVCHLMGPHIHWHYVYSTPVAEVHNAFILGQ